MATPEPASLRRVWIQLPGLRRRALTCEAFKLELRARHGIDVVDGPLPDEE